MPTVGGLPVPERGAKWVITPSSLRSDCLGASWRDGTEVVVSWILDVLWDILLQTACLPLNWGSPAHSLTCLTVLFCQASCTWVASALPCTTTSLPRSMEGALFCGWRTRTRPAWCPGQRTISRTCWSGQVRLAGKGPAAFPQCPGGRTRDSWRDGGVCAAWGASAIWKDLSSLRKSSRLFWSLFLSQNLKSS